MDEQGGGGRRVEMNETNRAPANGSLEMSLDEERIQPTKDPAITPADVLCGRDKTSFNHVGNKRFRQTVTNSLEQYMKAETRFDKSLVVHSIVDGIHSQGGRFLKRDKNTGRWYELTPQQCKEKVGHAVRDAVNAYEARKQAKAAKGKLKDPPIGTTKRKKVKSPELSPGEPTVPFPPPPPPQEWSALTLPSAYGYYGPAAYPMDIPSGYYPMGPSIPRALPGGGESDAAAAAADTARASGVARLRRAQPPPRPPVARGAEPAEAEGNGRGDEHDNFLAAIDSVLGPLPPDAEDPMESLMQRQRRSRRHR